MLSIKDQLLFAATSDDKNSIRNLIKGPDIYNIINNTNDLGETVLMILCGNGHDDIVEEIIYMDIPDIDYNIRDIDGNFLLLSVCAFGHIKLFKLLQERINFIDYNAHNIEGYTMLISACQRNHVEIVKLLLNCPGIDVNAKTNFITELNYSSLHIACAFNDVDILKELLKMPDIDVNILDNRLLSPLIYAAILGNYDAVKLLLECKDIHYNYITSNSVFSVFIPDKTWSALSMARFRGYTNITKEIEKRIIKDLYFLERLLSRDIIGYIVENFLE